MHWASDGAVQSPHITNAAILKTNELPLEQKGDF